MASKTSRRNFSRSSSRFSYRRRFVLSTEGRITEPEYFRHLLEFCPHVLVECLKTDGKSAPPYVLKRIKKSLKETPLERTDEAWLLVDKDNWTDDQLQPLLEWAQEEKRYNLAVSCPAFDFWLLLHFEEGSGAHSLQVCRARLRKLDSRYDKSIAGLKGRITPDAVRQAIERARTRDCPHSAPYSGEPGCTDVYRLVERILEAEREWRDGHP